jgi:hypothetical protein
MKDPKEKLSSVEREIRLHFAIGVELGDRALAGGLQKPDISERELEIHLSTDASEDDLETARVRAREVGRLAAITEQRGQRAPALTLVPGTGHSLRWKVRYE